MNYTILSLIGEQNNGLRCTINKYHHQYYLDHRFDLDRLVKIITDYYNSSEYEYYDFHSDIDFAANYTHEYIDDIFCELQVGDFELLNFFKYLYITLIAQLHGVIPDYKEYLTMIDGPIDMLDIGLVEDLNLFIPRVVV